MQAAALLLWLSQLGLLGNLWNCIVHYKNVTVFFTEMFAVVLHKISMYKDINHNSFGN